MASSSKLLTTNERDFVNRYLRTHRLLALNEPQWSYYNTLVLEGKRLRRDLELSDKEVLYRNQVRQIQKTWGVIAEQLSTLESHSFIDMHIMRYAMLVSILNLPMSPPSIKVH